MNKRCRILLLIIILLINVFPNEIIAGNIHNFTQAKIASAKINKNAPGDFYCNCKIYWYGKNGIIDLNSCGYKIRENKDRANRVEWEHVMPAWQFGHLLKCWRHGGRKHCNKDYIYRQMETDMHNLQPIIGEINGDRRNFMYGRLNNNIAQYGQCTMKIDFKKKIAEPPPRARGSIARTYFYMRDRYNLHLSHKETKLFQIWNKLYPVTDWECKRDNLIAQIQGNHNHYVEQACLARGIKS